MYNSTSTSAQPNTSNEIKEEGLSPTSHELLLILLEAIWDNIYERPSLSEGVNIHLLKQAYTLPRPAFLSQLDALASRLLQPKDHPPENIRLILNLKRLNDLCTNAEMLTPSTSGELTQTDQAIPHYFKRLDSHAQNAPDLISCAFKHEAKKRIQSACLATCKETGISLQTLEEKHERQLKEWQQTHEDVKGLSHSGYRFIEDLEFVRAERPLDPLALFEWHPAPEEFLIKNESLRQSITEETLKKIPPGENVPLGTLLWQCQEGIDVLGQDNYRLLNMLDSVTLNQCFAPEEQGTPEAEYSPVLLLCQTIAGNRLLQDIPRLIDHFTAEELNRPVQSGPSKGKSAAFFLYSSREGRILVENNPDLSSKLKPKSEVLACYFKTLLDVLDAPYLALEEGLDQTLTLKLCDDFTHPTIELKSMTLQKLYNTLSGEEAQPLLEKIKSRYDRIKPLSIQEAQSVIERLKGALSTPFITLDLQSESALDIKVSENEEAPAINLVGLHPRKLYDVLMGESPQLLLNQIKAQYTVIKPLSEEEGNALTTYLANHFNASFACIQDSVFGVAIQISHAKPIALKISARQLHTSLIEALKPEVLRLIKAQYQPLLPAEDKNDGTQNCPGPFLRQRMSPPSNLLTELSTLPDITQG